MQKDKTGKLSAISAVVIAAAIIAFGISGAALAQKGRGQNGGQEDAPKQNQGVGQNNGKGNDEVGQNNELKPNQPQNQPQDDSNGKAANGDKKNTADNKGQSVAEQHRSTVANVVQGLVHAADREQGGIGEQVRIIAQQQNDSNATTTAAIAKVENSNKNKIKTFLFGSDYKNLGVLRSQLVQTQNQISQLTRLKETAKYAASTTEIEAQIATLQQEQAKIENFIKTQENKFSLFGWLVKLFNK